MMALPAEYTPSQRSAARSAAMAGATAFMLIVSCVVVLAYHSDMEWGSARPTVVELVQGGPGGHGKRMAKVCFGKVCATTSAAFAKVLEGTEKRIFAEGEKQGIKMEQVQGKAGASNGQAAAQQRLQRHLKEVPEETLELQQRAEKRAEEAAARKKQEALPKWHSEWKSIFGSHN